MRQLRLRLLLFWACVDPRAFQDGLIRIHISARSHKSQRNIVGDGRRIRPIAGVAPAPFATLGASYI